MKRKPRTRAPRLGREQRVAEILNAAREVFSERGYQDSAMSEIAARVGVVEGAVYKYFDSKRELLLKVLECWYQDMFGDYARDLRGVNGARERLQLLIWRHLRSVREYPELCRLMFLEVRAERGYRGSVLHAMNRRYTRFLTGVLAEGVEAGEFRSDLPIPLLRDLVYGGIEHHSWNYLCGRGELGIDRIAQQITRVLCDGIGAREKPDMQREMQRLSRIASRIERALPPPVPSPASGGG